MSRTARTLRAALAAALLCGLLNAPAFAADCRGLPGKYLFDNRDKLEPVLKEQLGYAFELWQERYSVQVPFERAGDKYVYAAGCAKHACTIDEAFLGIDEDTCDIYLALLESERYTLVVPEQWPAPLEAARQDWMSR